MPLPRPMATPDPDPTPRRSVFRACAPPTSASAFPAGTRSRPMRVPVASHEEAGLSARPVRRLDRSR